jgi:hypothetical protein
MFHGFQLRMKETRAAKPATSATGQTAELSNRRVKPRGRSNDQKASSNTVAVKAKKQTVERKSQSHRLSGTDHRLSGMDPWANR